MSDARQTINKTLEVVNEMMDSLKNEMKIKRKPEADEIKAVAELLQALKVLQKSNG